MKSEQRIEVIRCFRFMRLFDITFFSILNINEKTISAIVAWPEDCIKGFPNPDDAQEIEWIKSDASNFDDALALGEHAKENGWIDSDRLCTTPANLQKSLDWPLEKLERAIKILLKIEVKMIDDGKPSDSFFFHWANDV
jgi:hypothetical protein